MAPCEAIYMLDSGTVMPDIRVMRKTAVSWQDGSETSKSPDSLDDIEQVQAKGTVKAALGRIRRLPYKNQIT
jgi:hypothetical protein